MVEVEEAADHPGNHREVEAKEDREDQEVVPGVMVVMAKSPGLP